VTRDSASLAVFAAGAMGRILTVAAGVLAILWALPCLAENWPGFRGPVGQGISQEKNLPVSAVCAMAGVKKAAAAKNRITLTAAGS
jgi:hypothetical protein